MNAAVLVEGARQIGSPGFVGDAGRVEGYAPHRLGEVGGDPTGELCLVAVGLEGAARRLRIALVVALLAVCVAAAALAGLLS